VVVRGAVMVVQVCGYAGVCMDVCRYAGAGMQVCRYAGMQKISGTCKSIHADLGEGRDGRT